MNEERYLTASQCATEARVTTGRVYQIVAEGQVPGAMKIGGRVWIPETGWRRWLGEHSQQLGSSAEGSDRR